jgi:hypothetical protein
MSRIQRKINTRNKFYILTNGKGTEKTYFSLLKSKKSLFDVKVLFYNEDIIGLIKEGKKLIDNDVNQVWCVCDVDDFFEKKNTIREIELAKKYNIKLAFSNMAFEVWLLSHYHVVSKSMGNKELINEMNNLLINLKIKKSYDKNDKELLKKYFLPKVDNAVINCKIICQKKEKEYEQNHPFDKNYKFWEWNPCSNVYELIESLKFRK